MVFASTPGRARNCTSAYFCFYDLWSAGASATKQKEAPYALTGVIKKNLQKENTKIWRQQILIDDLPNRLPIVIPAGNSLRQFPAALFAPLFWASKKRGKKIFESRYHEIFDHLKCFVN